ncbi:uncharacterized protein LOC106657301 [Trichogramma pretiosum]|uniref:uncharacterized protein LOC106657301 n=1 Tax=Trichogramma pretiosum TaxID=7493 RepID=UPI0006C9DDD0|nr:uncharacterized protein LOC106657301 [Trichogramma pretiosum]
MQDQNNEDSASVNSDESNVSSFAPKDKLEELINMELKHSGVYADVLWKNQFLKGDFENLYTSCQRFDEQKKKKSEVLEDYYEKLTELRKRNHQDLKDKLNSIILKINETNSKFHEAYSNYSSDVINSYIQFFDNEAESQEARLADLTRKLDSLHEKEKGLGSLMKKGPTSSTSLDVVINMLFESSMKRPEIQLDETLSKLSMEMEKLERRLQANQ